MTQINPNTGEIAEDAGWASQVKVARLDIARDLVIPVELQAAFKDHVDGVKARYSRLSGIYTSSGDGHTRMNRSASQGCDRVYNKDAEMKVKSPSGVVRWRFEAQLEGQRLARCGLRTLAGVTEQAAWDALAWRWSAMRLDEPIPAESTVLEQLSAITQEEQRKAMAFMAFQTLGKASDHYSRREARSIRATMKSVGLNPRRSLHDQSRELLQLPLETGLLSRIQR